MHKMGFGASREIRCMDLLLLQQPADLLCLLLGPKCPVVLNSEQKCMITVPHPPGLAQDRQAGFVCGLASYHHFLLFFFDDPIHFE